MKEANKTYTKFWDRTKKKFAQLFGPIASQPIKLIAIALFLLVMTLLASATVRITDTNIQVDGVKQWKSPDCIVDINGMGDSTTLQGCINTLPKGGFVKIRNGFYTITTSLLLPSNITIEGSGFNTIIKANTNFHIVTNNDTSNGNKNIALRNFHIMGNYSQANGNGIYFVNVTESRIKDLWIESTPQHGIQLDCTTNVIVDNVYSWNNSLDGFTTTDCSRYTTFTNSYSFNNGAYGFGIIQVDENRTSPFGTMVINNHAYNNNIGISTKGDSHSLISSNWVYNNSQEGINLGNPTIQGSNYTQVIDNHIWDNDASNTSHSAIYHHGCFAFFDGNTIYEIRSVPLQDYGLQLNKDCGNEVGDNRIGNMQISSVLGVMNNTKHSDLVLNKDSPTITLIADTNTDTPYLLFDKPSGGGAVDWKVQDGVSGVNNGMLGFWGDGTQYFGMTTSGFQLNVPGGGTMKLGFDGLVANTNPLLYSNGDYIVIEPANSGTLHLGFDNTNNATNVNMFNGNHVFTKGGEAKIAGVSSDGVGKVVCIKSDGNLGTCSDQPGAGGNCTCA